MKVWSTLKNHHLEQLIFKNRIQFALLVIGLLTLVLLSRLFYLQVIEYKRYQTASDENRIQVIPLPPIRGLIFDRNGLLLADNKPNFALTIVSEKSENLEKSLQQLGSLISIQQEHIEDFMEKVKQYRRPFEPIVLRSKLTEMEIAMLAANRHRFPEMQIEGELIRNYPFKEIFAHAIGYVGRINEEDFKNLEDPGNYKGSNYIGKTGLEKYYEDTLHGFTGLQRVETDAHGKVLRVLDEKLPIPGHNLNLHLDFELQKLAIELLGEQRGAVVAIEPTTGGILAFVSTPSFDPNLFVTGISHKDYSALRDSPNEPLFNRTIQGRYPPGSTIKPIIGLAGLEYNKTGWWKSINDPGWFKLENEDRLYRDWKREGHGKVNLEKAIYQSCDTYFYELSLALGIDNIHDFMSPFGFGHRTGVDITPESPGILPSREWKKKTQGTFWYPGETLISGIGQGFMLATPLQLALSTAILANKGIIVKPSLIQSIENSANEKISPELESLGSITLSENKNWEQMFEAMRKVMHYPKGTAYYSGLRAKYSIAGKTGTAQVKGIAQGEEYDEDETALRHRDHSLFIGFAPINEPKIAIAVIIENGGSGSAAAAPLGRKLFDNYLLR